jgi:signal transduction histidine kinase
MKPARKPENEKERLQTLRAYQVLDTLPEREYDDITRIAADICGTPISLISFVDGARQWFKSKVGLEAEETSRELAFCAHAILEPQEVFVVNDTSSDDRFSDNPLVTGAPHVGFYTGVPLVSSNGHALGTLCVVDNRPNDLTDHQKLTLKALGRQVVAHLEVRRLNAELQQKADDLRMINSELEKFAHVVAHDIKSPCSSIMMGVDYLEARYGADADASNDNIIGLMKDSARNIIRMVDGILLHSKVVNASQISKDSFTFGELMDELKVLVHGSRDVMVIGGDESAELEAPHQILLQILMNLCTNAIKYNDKQQPKVVVGLQVLDTEYAFSVSDNGIGIGEEDHSRIFDLFSTLGQPTRNNEASYGIGLATVQRLVQKLGGSITLTSSPGEGATFTFTVPK